MIKKTPICRATVGWQFDCHFTRLWLGIELALGRLQSFGKFEGARAFPLQQLMLRVGVNRTAFVVAQFKCLPKSNPIP